jgi:hypothetical protein
LDRQRRQRILAALGERGIKRVELTVEDGHRPAIRDDVVHREQQHMIVIGEADQPRADQRAARKVKACLRLLGPKPRQLTLPVGGFAQIVDG